MEFLEGKKTYIMAVVMLIVAATSMVGIAIPGFETVNAGQLITEALAILFLRFGIAKIGS